MTMETPLTDRAQRIRRIEVEGAEKKPMKRRRRSVVRFGLAIIFGLAAVAVFYCSQKPEEVAVKSPVESSKPSAVSEAEFVDTTRSQEHRVPETKNSQISAKRVFV